MGLDMYALVTIEKPAAAFGFKTEQAERIHYWRKHGECRKLRLLSS